MKNTDQELGNWCLMNNVEKRDPNALIYRYGQKAYDTDYAVWIEESLGLNSCDYCPFSCPGVECLKETIEDIEYVIDYIDYINHSGGI